MDGKVTTPVVLRGSVRTIPLIDDTLTNKGQAADAKATGDALAEHTEVLEDHKATLDSHKETLAAHGRAIDSVAEEFAAADNALRQEFEAADNAIREAFAAAEETLRQDIGAVHNDVRGEFAEADDAVRQEFGEADNAVAEMLRKEMAEADDAVRTTIMDSIAIPNLGTFDTSNDLQSVLTDVLDGMDNMQTKSVAVSVSNIAGVATGAYPWMCTIRKMSDAYATITAESCYGGAVTKIVTAVINGEWQPWEWENPPMKEGVEYRTTERDNSDPIYVKLVGVSVPVLNDTYGVPDVIGIDQGEYVFVNDITGIVYKTDDGTSATSGSVFWDLSNVSIKLYKDTYDGQSPSDRAQSFKLAITNISVQETPAYARIIIKYVRK